MGRVTVVTGPASEPVTLAEAKAQCRVDGSDSDTLLGSLITLAREQVELIARRALITQTLALTLDGWPAGRVIVLPRPPLQSVTSVGYVDEDGNSGSVDSADYVVDTVNERIVLKRSASWPSAVLRETGAITVTYVAGYGASSADVPEVFRQAMRLMIGEAFENRESLVLGSGLTMVDMGRVERLLMMQRGAWF